MEVLKDRYSITELSRCLKVTDHALRYYEREFNMQVPKDKRGRRYYTPDLANIMYKIKAMRDEGFEIKAIKKILQSENIINPPVPMAESCNPLSVPMNNNPNNNPAEIKRFFLDFGEQLSSSFSSEMESTKEEMISEITKTKLELGACFENNVRKLENRLDKHFDNVDRSITIWRENNKSGLLKRLSRKLFR
ncbi:MAG: MerR family transcriptional regulator [Clostridium sp.]|nr:MerR family transcriptional regulator [Clostridium sp.]